MEGSSRIASYRPKTTLGHENILYIICPPKLSTFHSAITLMLTHAVRTVGTLDIVLF
jgi:hypothetical protein